MSEATGTIEWIGSRAFQGKNLWSFKVNDTFFRCGQKVPQAEKGQQIKFKYDTDAKGNHNVNVDSIEVVAEVPKEAPKSSGGGGSAKENWDARAKYWEDKEARDIVNGNVIRYQSATNTAVEIVKLAQAEGILPVSGSKKADKFDALVEVVGKVRDDLIRDYERVERKYRDHGTLFDEKAAEQEWADLEDADDWNTE